MSDPEEKKTGSAIQVMTSIIFPCRDTLSMDPALLESQLNRRRAEVSHPVRLEERGGMAAAGRQLRQTEMERLQAIHMQVIIRVSTGIYQC